MGLSIMAVSGLQKIKCLYNGDMEPTDPQTGFILENTVKVIQNSGFCSQFDDLENLSRYSYTRIKYCYDASYSAYNRWREALAKLAGYPYSDLEEFTGHQIGAFDVECGPFHELVCFSDCEGTIGPKTSAKLYQDFCDFQDRANLSEDVAWIKTITP